MLPYTQIFQSGVLFLGYNFGLPVIATDVGSMKDDIVLGKTGYLCAACDAAQLAGTIEGYFSSEMFRGLERQKREIRDFARRHNSWTTVGEKTRDVYSVLHS